MKLPLARFEPAHSCATNNCIFLLNFLLRKYSTSKTIERYKRNDRKLGAGKAAADEDVMEVSMYQGFT